MSKERTPRIVGIDSMVLIYANAIPKKKSAKKKSVKKKTKNNDPAQDDLFVRARLLLHMLRNDTIILPTISVAELLIPVPTHQKGSLSAVLAKRFLCAPFDLKSAAIAAELWAHHKQLPANQHYKDRNLLKSDVMILGAAHSAGATIFYTHDRQCRKLASHVMTARDLPKNDPDDMYAVSDIRRGEL